MLNNELPQATILMCTYNAEKYIYEQLESLLKQTYKNIKIVIYDDDSTDNTVMVIKDIIEKSEKDIILCCNEVNSGGPCENFMKILKDYKEEKYIFFSDQDDVWDDNKIELMMKKMLELEAKNKIPYIVCHNCNITDMQLNIIDYKCIKKSDFFELIMKPSIPGCCMMINQEVIKGLKFDDRFIYMHDWYICLVVALIGHIEILQDNLIDYRQHDKNQIGYTKKNCIRKIVNGFKIGTKIKNYEAILKQLYVISCVNENVFLGEYKFNYEHKKIYSIIRMFWINNVIEHNIHGIYQAIVLQISMLRIKKEN